MNGRVTSSRTRVVTVIVTVWPGLTTPCWNVTCWPLKLTVPEVVLVERICTWAGRLSVITALLNGRLPGLVMMMVHVTISPGRVKGGFTLLVMNGSCSVNPGGSVPPGPPVAPVALKVKLP